MANWSDTYIEIQVPHIFEQAKLLDWFKLHISNNRFTYQDIEFEVNHVEHSIEDDTYTITIQASGRWETKIDDLAQVLCNNFDITFASLYDSEQGLNFFHLIEINDSEITLEQKTYHLSDEHIQYLDDPQYFIESYFDFITEAIDNGCKSDVQDLLDVFSRNGIPESTFKEKLWQTLKSYLTT